MPTHKISLFLLTFIFVFTTGCSSASFSSLQSQSVQDIPDNSALVIDVLDGDTITVKTLQGTEKVRLIGIDAPEIVHDEKPGECFGPEATTKLKELVHNKIVRLEEDSTQASEDQYGRLLRYVFVEGSTSVNQQLLADGYAYEFTFKEPYIYQQQFRDAETLAEKEQQGLWSPETCNGKKTNQ